MLAFLQELEGSGARYMVIGAMALGFWGCPRTTGDLDLWVDGREAPLLMEAITRFFGGADLGLKEDDLKTPGVVQLGYAPNRIDLVILEEASNFDEAWERAVRFPVGGVSVVVADRRDLIRLKEAFGRPQDLADVAALKGQP